VAVKLAEGGAAIAGVTKITAKKSREDIIALVLI
jgi:hypothetical protein